jgi:GNAT superfamily N-acetyltransferase
MQLRMIAPEAYARLVLPLSADLWAGRRDLQTYIAQTSEIARGKYGRRFYRTIGLYDGNTLTASCKRYERTIRMGKERLRVVGVGAVYTPEALRGRGYASAMLGTVLDESRRHGCDAVYLFSDIRPRFYEEIGFRLQPSRTIRLRADSLERSRIEISRLEEGDWRGVQRCFALIDRTRAWSFARTPLAWDWVRTRLLHGSEHARGATANFVVRDRGIVHAYVLGARVPQEDRYIVDEFGFAGAAGATILPALLRGAAGDLRRIEGWLPPDGARSLLPRGTVRRRRTAIFMIAPLTAKGRRWCRLSERETAADGVWATDHI